MDTDSTSFQPRDDRPPASRSAKALWAVIGVLAVSVAALGGALVHQRANTVPPQPAASVAVAPPPVLAPDDGKPPSLAMPVPATIPPPVRAPEVIARNDTVPGPAPAPGVAPAAPARPVCAVCGHVESVQPVKRPKPTTGVGAVAGGVVGGVLGNQIGHGNGRTLATVAGAVGGGFAGNAVEKHTRAETVYQVRVRMDDGSLRTVETQTAPPVGKPVTLKKGVLRPADGRK